MDIFLNDIGLFSDKRARKFHQGAAKTEKNYSGKWGRNVLVINVGHLYGRHIKRYKKKILTKFTFFPIYFMYFLTQVINIILIFLLFCSVVLEYIDFSFVTIICIILNSVISLLNTLHDAEIWIRYLESGRLNWQTSPIFFFRGKKKNMGEEVFLPNSIISAKQQEEAAISFNTDIFIV